MIWLDRRRCLCIYLIELVNSYKLSSIELMPQVHETKPWTQEYPKKRMHGDCRTDLVSKQQHIDTNHTHCQAIYTNAQAPCEIWVRSKYKRIATVKLTGLTQTQLKKLDNAVIVVTLQTQQVAPPIFHLYRKEQHGGHSIVYYNMENTLNSIPSTKF